MNTFQLKIIASNKVFFDGQAQSLIIPRLDGGSEAYLAMHENCVVPIEFGEMKIVDANGKTINAFVGSGFLEFLDNEAMLVCISACQKGKRLRPIYVRFVSEKFHAFMVKRLKSYKSV